VSGDAAISSAIEGVPRVRPVASRVVALPRSARVAPLRLGPFMRSFHASSPHVLALVLALGAVACGDDGGGAGGGGGADGTGAAGQGGAGDGGAGDGGDGPATIAPSSSSVTNTIATAVASSGTGSAEIFCPSGGYSSFPQSDECDMLQQDCEPGFTCERARVGGETVTRCTPRGGLKGVASACVSEDECESGLFCVFNVCTPVCCPNNEEPCDGGNCNLNLSFSNGDTIVVCTYSKQCEPLTEDACPPGSGCHFEEPTAPTCIQGSGEDVPEGGTCGALNDCDDMQQCSPFDDTCRWICALEDNGMEPGLGGCPDGQSCAETGAIATGGIGICRPD
jgi:hypothetical protein